MSYLYQFNLIVHVIAGALALCLFLIPVLMRKGGVDHKTVGRYYSYCMYSVALTGLVMTTFIMIVPAVVMPHLLTDSINSQARIEQARVFAWFLSHLAILIWVSVLYGRRVLAAREARHQLRRPLLLGLLGILLINGLALFVFGVITGRVLQIIFGLLGLNVGASSLHYIFRAHVAPRSWLREHLSAYIGSGIGAYTAFLVFGGRQLALLNGQWQLLWWIAPSILGGLYIAWASRRYAPRSRKL